MKLAALLLVLTTAPSWQQVGPGVWQREMPMAKSGPLSAVQAIVVRIDPAKVQFALDTATRDYGTRGAWTSDQLPANAMLAANTGQFIGGVMWGWVVRDGTELSAPGTGTLAMSFVVDSSGAPALLTPAETATRRNHVRLAFQSYPALLTDDGSAPFELQARGRGVNLDHRDSRLAIGQLADGSIVIVLTRFTALGSAGATMPFGPTVGEMSLFMQTLGCQRAMLLDGGISSQLSVRQATGDVRHWTNWRKVPMGLVVTPRVASASASGR